MAAQARWLGLRRRPVAVVPRLSSTGSLSRKFLRLIRTFASAREFDLISRYRAFEHQHERVSAEFHGHFERDIVAGDLAFFDFHLALRQRHRAREFIAVGLE